MYKTGMAALTAVAWLAAPAGAQVFESIDHAGECYGVPTGAGSTKELSPGKAYALEAYGSEYGHHCKADQGRFVFQEIEGDFDVSARVVSLGNERKTAAKACLMVRENAEDPSARFAAIMAIADLPFTRRHHHGFPDSFTFDLRARRGGNLANEGFRYAAPPLRQRRKFPNVWLRLKREGDRITSFFGEDGVRWTELPPEDSWVNLPAFRLGRRVAVGMCVASEPEVKPDIKVTARFDRLRGFRPRGPARLAGPPAAAVAEPALPPLSPKKRPLGLGRDMPALDTKLEAADGAPPRTLKESAGTSGTLIVFETAGCSAPADAPARIAALARPFQAKGITTIVTRDAALASALGATAGGQVFLFDRDRRLAYSGATTGLDLEGKRRDTLKDALAAVAAGRYPDIAQTPPPECAVGAP